jgi:hypothetical protein
MSDVAAVSGAREVRLPNGLLRVHVHRADWSLDRLCGFAARNNPRRGFLFVSKVLGKHWPSDPREMALAHNALASRVPEPSGAPVVFVGMAETATGLGQGVFEAYLAQHGLGSAIYIQTTRYPLSGATIVPFDEKHSHAQSLRLHWPEQAALREVFLRTTTAVLIDDELSTGQTFLSLTSAYRAVNPNLKRLSLVSLTDFMGEQARANFIGQSGLAEVEFISLLAGAFEFEADPSFFATPPPVAQTSVGCRRAQIGPMSARLGTDQTLKLPSDVVPNLYDSLPAGRPVLVLGTGEFMHPAFCVARDLAELGLDVRVQSTTRSPILLAGDVGRCIDLQDPYGEAVPNYLYNVAPEAQSVILCCETQPSAALDDMTSRLGARVLMWGGPPDEH